MYKKQLEDGRAYEYKHMDEGRVSLLTTCGQAEHRNGKRMWRQGWFTLWQP